MGICNQEGQNKSSVSSLLAYLECACEITMEKLIIRNVRPPDIEREIIVDYNFKGEELYEWTLFDYNRTMDKGYNWWILYNSVCFMSVFICVWKLSDLWVWTGLRICQVWDSLDTIHKFIIKSYCWPNPVNENIFIVCDWIGERALSLCIMRTVM